MDGVAAGVVQRPALFGVGVVFDVAARKLRCDRALVPREVGDRVPDVVDVRLLAGLGCNDIERFRSGGVAELDLWQRAPNPIALGDAFAVTAGCDKRLTTCRQTFANVANFRGFPHMPGNDFVVRMPRQGEPGLDGGSLFR